MPDNTVECNLDTEHNEPLELTEIDDSNILSFEHGAIEGAAKMN